MLLRRSLAAAGVLATVALVAASGGVASATVTTLYVSGAPVGSGTSCASPGYNTIQAAVDAAPAGAKVKVCAGTYAEQVVVSRSVSIVGAGEASTVIQLPAGPAGSADTCESGNQEIVDVCGAGVSLSLSHLTVQGTWPANVCNDNLYGITVFGGAHLAARGVHVEAIGGDPLTDGCQGGVGIEVGDSLQNQSGSASLAAVTVTDYQKNGITADGTGTTLKVSNSTVTGAGPSPATAQNGIQISDGATGTIGNSTITGNECDHPSCGPDVINDYEAAGVLFYNPGTSSVSRVTGSVISDNDMGVYNSESAPTTKPFVSVAYDTLTGNRDAGVELDEGWASVTHDAISGGNIGVAALNASWQTFSPRGTVSGDTISGAGVAAVEVASDATPTNPAVRLSVSKSDLATANAAGVINQSPSVIAVKNDWWGDASGPSGWSFGTGSSVDANVNFFPWETDSAMTTAAVCTVAGSNITSSAADAVMCGTGGNNYITYTGTGPALLLGNGGNDHLIAGSGSGNYVIGGSGNDVIDGNNGSGYIQGRGGSDTCLNDSGYTVNGC